MEESGSQMVKAGSGTVESELVRQMLDQGPNKNLLKSIQTRRLRPLAANGTKLSKSWLVADRNYR